jgi:hypothetical protein
MSVHDLVAATEVLLDPPARAKLPAETGTGHLSDCIACLRSLRLRGPRFLMYMESLGSS